MRYAKLISGVPVPTSVKDLLDSDGYQHPPKALLDKTWRDAHGVVQIKDQPYDSTTEYLAANADGYTDLGGGVWQENIAVIQKDIGTLKARLLKKIQNKREQVLRGGITVLTKNVSTDSGDIDKLLLMDSWRTRNAWPAGGVSIFTIDDGRVKVNEAQFNTLLDALAVHFYQTDNNADAHTTAAEGLATQQEVINYDFSTGWPSNPVTDQI